MIDGALELLGSVEEFITELSQNPWFLLFLFVVAFLDSVFPIVPSEFSVIAGGVASGSGMLIDDQRVLSIVLVIVLAAVGAYGGDSLAYAIGSRSDKVLRKIFFRGDKGEKRLFATGEQIRKRGGLLLITARFIPGGRTAIRSAAASPASRSGPGSHGGISWRRRSGHRMPGCSDSFLARRSRIRRMRSGSPSVSP